MVWGITVAILVEVEEDTPLLVEGVTAIGRMLAVAFGPLDTGMPLAVPTAEAGDDRGFMFAVGGGSSLEELRGNILCLRAVSKNLMGEGMGE